MAGIDVTKIRKSIPTVIEKGKETKKKSYSFLDKEINLFGAKISDKFKESLYLELSILVSAGVDIRAALELLEKQQTNKKFTALYLDLKNKVIGGLSISEAFKSTSHFTAYEYYSLQIGEETGKITNVLQELAAFYSKKLKQRRQLIQALSYPVIVIFTSVVAIVFMFNFIVPMFSDIFKRFGGDLPYITKVIVGLSVFFQNNLLYMLLVLVGFVLMIQLNKKKVWYRKYSSIVTARLPIFGAIVTRVHLARCCSSFGLLVGSKVPLLQAIRLVKQMIDYYPISTSLDKIEADILQGESLHKSLSKFAIYDPRMVALVKVGEEVNKLDFFFNKLSAQYNDEIEYRASILSSALEPFIIIFLGLMVGIILIAMYLPLFQLSTNIG
jgi:type IV pilus assembly protein PilC